MLVGERIKDVSGTKTKREAIKGLSINISINDVRINGRDVEIDYSYVANYDEDVGKLEIKGTLVANEEEALAKNIEDSWKKDKKLPDDYMPMILSAINYSGSANGTLIARVVGLTAPLIPPRIQLAPKGKAPPKKK